MNVAYREVNQNGELLLEDEFNDDLEISEAGRISCKELQIGKTTIVTTGRVLQNVTLSDLITLTVGDMLISGHH